MPVEDPVLAGIESGTSENFGLSSREQKPKFRSLASVLLHYKDTAKQIYGFFVVRVIAPKR